MSEQTPAQDAPGFQIPPPTDQSPPLEPTPGPSAEATVSQITVDLGVADTGSRDLLVGAGVTVVLMVCYFFARNAYANMLVRRRVEPNRANSAGWALFTFLTTLTVAVVLSALNPIKFLAPLYIGPLGAVALVALILTIMSSRR